MSAKSHGRWALVLIIALISTSAFVLAPNPSPSTAQTNSLTQLVSSSDNQLSLRLPEGWVFEDLVASEGIFAYGDTEASMIGRLNDLRGNPALLLGSGGSITLFDISTFGLPEVSTPVLAQMMAGGIQGIQNAGGRVLEDAEPIEITPELTGFRATIVAGNEQGFILVVGSDQLVELMTATSTPAEWNANRDLMDTIARSLRMPAENAPPTTTSSGGLGSNPAATPTQAVPTDIAVRNPENTLEFRIPLGWQSLEITSNDPPSTQLFFARSENELNVLQNSLAPAEPGGVVYYLEKTALGLSASIGIELLFAALDPGADTISQRQETITGQINGFDAMWFEYTNTTPIPSQGYWLVIDFDDSLALVVLRTLPNDWAQSGETLEQIFRSIRYDASGLPSSGGLGSPSTPTATPSPTQIPTRAPATVPPTPRGLPTFGPTATPQQMPTIAPPASPTPASVG